MGLPSRPSDRGAPFCGLYGGIQQAQAAAEADYGIIYGIFTDKQRKGILKPEVPVGEDVSAQDRLLAYSGRNPS